MCRGTPFGYLADGTHTLIAGIIRQLGYTSANAQLLTIPVYVAAAIYVRPALLIPLSAAADTYSTQTVLIAVKADKTRKRARFVLIPYATAIAGLIICLATPQPRLPGLILFAVFLIAMGAYSVVPSVISWNSNNLSGEWKRGIGIGVSCSWSLFLRLR